MIGKQADTNKRANLTRGFPLISNNSEKKRQQQSIMICDDISIIFEALLKKIHQNGIETTPRQKSTV